MNFSGTAFIVIDVQQGLFEKPIPIYNAKQLISNIQLLLERAHQANSPVFFIQHSTDKILVEGTPGWHFHPEVQPSTVDRVVQKHHGSAFEGTSLQDQLNTLQVKKLVLCGLVTHGCVKAACLDGIKMGYEVTLVQDGHSSFSKDAAKLINEWNEKLSQKGVILSAAADIYF